MTRNEAKTILLLYRPGTTDAGDPQVAEALALARRDPELDGWLTEHCTRQEVLQAKFRQIVAPAGLKEQILSEHAARKKIIWWQRPSVLAAAAAVVLLIGLASLLLRPYSDDTLGNYRIRMASAALRGYAMDLETNDLAQIRAHLAQQQAPADYDLPAGLQKAAAAGCAVQKWQNAKVSMVCFRTGKPLAPGEQSDLWLFVIERNSLKQAPAPGTPQFARVSKLMTATWTRGDKVYLLGMEGDEQMLRQYL